MPSVVNRSLCILIASQTVPRVGGGGGVMVLARPVAAWRWADSANSSRLCAIVGMSSTSAARFSGNSSVPGLPGRGSYPKRLGCASHAAYGDTSHVHRGALRRPRVSVGFTSGTFGSLVGPAVLFVSVRWSLIVIVSVVALRRLFTPGERLADVELVLMHHALLEGLHVYVLAQ